MSNAALFDVQRITRLAAEPRIPGDTVKAAIGRASRALGLSYRRAYDFWYGSPNAAVRAWEADRLRTQELAILARRRERLERELQAIRARLTPDRRNHAVDRPAVGDARLLVRGAVDERRAVAGGEGLIDDPRQTRIPGVA